VGVSEPSYDGVSKSTASAWDYSRVAASRLQNGWDSALPSGTVASFDSLYLKQDVCGAAVLRAVAEVLALPLDTFEAPPGSDLGTIRLISYPGRPAEQDGWTMANSNSGDHHWTYTDEEEEEANVGIAPHTDFEAFTLMHQDAPGLQLLRRDQLARGPEAEWYDAPVGPEFVVRQSVWKTKALESRGQTALESRGQTGFRDILAQNGDLVPTSFRVRGLDLPSAPARDGPGRSRYKDETESQRDVLSRVLSRVCSNAARLAKG